MIRLIASARVAAFVLKRPRTAEVTVNEPGFCTPCEVDRDCDPAGQCAGQKCVAHVCATVTPFSCDDGRRDTRDRCVLDAGGAPRCQHDCLAASACDDGNKCNGTEVCAAGHCGSGTALDCADDDPCTDDTCAPATGCVHTPRTQFAATRCRVDTIDRALGQADPDALVAPFRLKIGRARDQARAKLADAEAAGQAGKKKREGKLLRAAKQRLAKIETLVGTAQVKDKISPSLADVLARGANDATDAVVIILDGLRTGH